MNTEEKLSIYFELEKEGYKTVDIAPKLDMTEKALRNLLRRKNYTCINGKYVPKDNVDTEDIPKNNTVVKDVPAIKADAPKETKSKPKKINTNIDATIKEDIREIKEILLSLKEDAGGSNPVESISKPITGNEISIDELKHFSIRAGKSTLNRFHELCERYPNINKSYIYTLALEEFINNHK